MLGIRQLSFQSKSLFVTLCAPGNANLLLLLLPDQQQRVKCMGYAALNTADEAAATCVQLQLQFSAGYQQQAVSRLLHTWWLLVKLVPQISLKAGHKAVALSIKILRVTHCRMPCTFSILYIWYIICITDCLSVSGTPALSIAVGAALRAAA